MALCAFAFDIDDGKASPLCGGRDRILENARRIRKISPWRLNAPGAASVVQGEQEKS